MTDKEQIIINDVNVSGCKYYNKNIKTDCLLYPLQPDACKDNSNCYYKQLARKTQECEELKEYLQANQPTGICETCMATAVLQNDKYYKALEEIEEATKEISNYLNIGCDMDKCEDCNHFKPFCINQCVCFLIGQGDLILDIINKVKGLQ